MNSTLTVVGCSGSAPGPLSACSCYLVERDGYRLLLDLGTGAIGPLQRHVAVTDIDATFVSHGHSDHCRDLADLVYLRHRVGQTDPVLVYGPEGVRESLLRGWPVGEPDQQYYRFGPAPTRLGPWRVRVADVVHHDLGSWAIRLDDQLCYTGDTEPCAAIDDLAAGCAVLLAEAAGFDAERPRAHLTAGDAGRLAARSGARLLVLTHLRAWLDHGALLAEAAAQAPCPVVLATPDLRLALPPAPSTDAD